jgi:hypothetical protein
MAVFMFDVDARLDSWQHSSVDLGPGERAEVSAYGCWMIFPPHVHGAGGHGTTAVSRQFVCPGAIEGCLLVKEGQGRVHSFSADDQVISVAVPGSLAFQANDERVEPSGGAAYARRGFADNNGCLCVTIRVFEKAA